MGGLRGFKGSSTTTSEDLNISLLNSPANVTDARGIEITTNRACTLVSVDIGSPSSATKCYLTDSSANILATANITALKATFNYALATSTIYLIVIDDNGAAYSYRDKDGGTACPVTGTNLDATRSVHGVFGYGATYDTYSRSIVKITTSTTTNIPPKMMGISKGGLN